MTQRIVPGFSEQPHQFFSRLSENEQRTVLIFAQRAKRFIETEKVNIRDSSREPKEYECLWRGFRFRFKMLPQSGTPVFIEIHKVSKKTS